MKRKTDVGKLEEIPIRDIFPHEAHDFTVWLSDNLNALSSELGFDLLLEKREHVVEGVRADIVCADSSGNRVVIENQLETSDDDHFTRLIQYMGKLGANTAIWITPDPTSKHQEIVQVLNAQSKPGFGYYLVTVKAIRIDDSRPYPLFQVLVRPENQSVVASEIIYRESEEASAPVQKPLGSLRPVWCFYPRRDDATYRLFLKERIVGLGFGLELGDLRRVDPTLEAFRALWLSRFPQTSPKAASTFCSMFYSFAHRMKIGDLVVYAPTWKERKLYVGRIKSAYEFQSKVWKILPSDYPHRRSIEWVDEFARDRFSPEALKGITVTLAVFRVRNETFLEELNNLSGLRQ